MIAVIPKPGKADYSAPKSYRPVLKLLEEVIAQIIHHDIGAHNPVPLTQTWPSSTTLPLPRKGRVQLPPV
jgi:hypothetical protein